MSRVSLETYVSKSQPTNKSIQKPEILIETQGRFIGDEFTEIIDKRSSNEKMISEVFFLIKSYVIFKTIDENQNKR